MSPKSLCAVCGKGGVQQRTVTRSFGRGESLLIIEKIPMFACPSCGESYFAAATLHELERIKTLRRSMSVKRKVAVAQF